MSLWKVLPVIAVVGALAAPAATAKPAAGKNIVQIASGDQRFTTLVTLVQSAGLAETLSSGRYTVFAPTDAAFAKVPKSTLDALASDPEQLKAVLTYHVVKGSVPASKVVKLKSAKTVNGARVAISVKRGAVYLNRTSKVTQADIKASNGIIHVINRVLLPPS